MLSAYSIQRPLKALLQLSLLSLSSSLHTHQHMISTRGDGQGGRGIIFTPRSGTYSNVVYFFHGLGDTAEGWMDMMPQFGIENTKYVLPTAPTRPISLNGGYSMPGWSDIYGLDESSKEDQEGFDSSADRVNKMIQAEIDNGINPSRIVVAGFSQGGALAYHIALRSKHKLGGCIGLSTWLPLRNSYPQALSEPAKTLPVLHLHGDVDQVVPYTWGQHSNALAKQLISNPEPIFITIQGLGHGWSSEELEPIQSFIRKAFNS